LAAAAALRLASEKPGRQTTDHRGRSPKLGPQVCVPFSSALRAPAAPGALVGTGKKSAAPGVLVGTDKNMTQPWTTARSATSSHSRSALRSPIAATAPDGARARRCPPATSCPRGRSSRVAVRDRRRAPGAQEASHRSGRTARLCFQSQRRTAARLAKASSGPGLFTGRGGATGS
jgi:hypothetical protein